MKRLAIFAGVAALPFLAMQTISGGLWAQQESKLISFDEETVGAWIDEKKAEDPDFFENPVCLKSDAFQDEVGVSCLAQQAIFLLNEVNQRRTIEQKALRRTLKATDERRQEAAKRADLAEGTLKQAQASFEQVDDLAKRVAELEAAIEVESQAAQDLRKTNALLIDAYKSLTEQLHQGLQDSLN